MGFNSAFKGLNQLCMLSMLEPWRGDRELSPKRR